MVKNTLGLLFWGIFDPTLKRLWLISWPMMALLLFFPQSRQYDAELIFGGVLLAVGWALLSSWKVGFAQTEEERFE